MSGDCELFLEHWNVKLKPGMSLEILDKSDYDVYECVVTRIESGRIYVKRDDRRTEELADVICLQPASNKDEDY